MTKDKKAVAAVVMQEINWMEHVADHKPLKRSAFGRGAEAYSQFCRYMSAVYLHRAEEALKQPSLKDKLTKRIEREEARLTRLRAALVDLK